MSDKIPSWNVVHKLEKRSLLIAINCVAALSILFFGYDQGMMSGVNNASDYISLMKFGYTKDVDGEPTPVVTNSLLQGGIVAVYYLGTLVGGLFGGWLGDRTGRIKSIAVGAAWATVGAALQCSAQNHDWMICARFINGIGTGILNAIVPVWATETAEHTSRGQFIAIEFTLNIFGVVLAYWLEFGLSFIDGGKSAFRWRFPIAFQIIFLLVLFVAVWFFPESPRWLVKVGREDEARYILQRLRGSSPEDRVRAEAEFQDILNIAEMEKTVVHGDSYLSMLFGYKSGDLHIGRRVQLVVWLQIMQEWVGIAGVTVYAPTIFSIAGFDSTKSQWISGLNNVFYMFATLVCVFTLDRIGRRWTLYWGSVVQGIAMFLAGGFSRLAINAKAAGNISSASSYGAAAASMIFIFTSTFGATWLTVPWVYPAEIFPLAVRARGNAWGVVGWSIGNGWLTLLCPVMFEAIGEKTLYVFAASNVITIPMVWALYPESNQRTLEDMDLLFAAPTPWTWDAEKNFARLKAENPGMVQSLSRKGSVMDPETDTTALPAVLGPDLKGSPSKGIKPSSNATLQKSLRRISLHPTLTPYRRRVYRALLSVPEGRWTTYSAMATYLNSSARAVGNAMRTNPFAPEVPCHRVLAADRSLGGYKGEWKVSKHITNGSFSDEKRTRLKEEGVFFDGDGKVGGVCFKEFRDLGAK
ncbi:multicopper oxidase [Penicillium atrosanguineum]|uniref:multicopper oxidase n=1 Tax=Penicillium atrosanguineum TaxID=1132637 RepID=UPI002392B8D2|nr:multicopper oxidase [Penicillium atrosanguineum]KAJ5296867.1 multicopper oxidase [Penicillium atrosanguineum]